MPTDLNIAVIYVRVSGARQVREGNGLKSQEQRCRQYAKMKGYSVVAVFREQAKSGGSLDRPELREMLAFLEQQRTQIVVIVDDPKRWARDVIIHFSLKDEIAKRGGRLESPSFMFQDDAIGRFTETIYAAGAELERNQNREQVRNRMRARLEMGFWPFHPPAGYRWVKHPTYKRILAPDEPKASIIKQALEQFATGMLASKADVARFLVKSGYFTESPKYPCTSLQHADRILTTMLYTGHIEYQKWGITLRKGHHPALVSMAIYRTVQERLSGKGKSFVREDEREEFVLRNFIACGICGTKLTATWSKGTSKRYGYYYCWNKNCGEYGRTTAVALMHERFASMLDTLRCPEETIDILRTELHCAWNALTGELEKKRSERPQRLKEISRQIDSLTDNLMILTRAAAISAVEKKIETLEHEKVELEDQTYDPPFVGVDVQSAIDVGLTALRNPRSLWQSSVFTTKRALQGNILAAPVRHDRNNGLQTPNLRLPYRISTASLSTQYCLVDCAEKTSNGLLEEVIRLGLQVSQQSLEPGAVEIPDLID